MSFESVSEQPRASVSRRDFLAVGGLSMVGLSAAEQAAIRRARERSGDRSCILVLLSGGPSQLETFDPKPDAPREVRGPLKPISTALPGVHFSECLPRLAERADRLVVLRSIFHEAAPTHEAGLQQLQTGRLVSHGTRYASLGSMVSRLLGPRGNAPAHVVIPGRLSQTGVETYRGDGSGFLGEAFEPILPDWPSGLDVNGPLIPEFVGLKTLDQQPFVVREAYGETRIGRLLHQARQLVERGVRVVTVNCFTRLDGHVTWDAHADRIHAPGTLFDYRDMIGPQFDRACAALLDDLQQRGLLDETLVICAGEMGRSPRLNEHGGRDHWTRAWSVMMAGCGLPRGAVVGATDPTAAEPTDDPIALPRLVSTIYSRLRIDLAAPVQADWPISALVDAEPVDALVS